MKIDLTQQYENGDGTPAIDRDTKRPIILKDILEQVCLNETCPPDQKVKRYSIYRSIKKSKVGFVLLEAEEIALLKAAVLQTHTVLVVGQTHEMLERSYVPPSAQDEAGHAVLASDVGKKPFDPDSYKDAT